MTYYRFECCLCDETWGGGELPSIAKRAARHYNYEHGDELRYHHEPFDTVERGGDHIHGNTYSYERIDLYLTAYDVLERVGRVDGWLLVGEDTMACEECHRVLEPSDERVLLNPDDHYDDKWHCQPCDDRLDVERRMEENRQLDAFARGESA